MANKSLTDLTARTATADSDLIHVNSGGTDYKQAKLDFLLGNFQHNFVNNTLLTSQAQALPTQGTYFGTIGSYGHQTDTGVPENASFYVKVQCIAYNYKVLEIWKVDNAEVSHYINTLANGNWSGYVRVPYRSEITSLNSSLTNSFTWKSSTEEASVATGTSWVKALQFSVTQSQFIRGFLRYSATPPSEIMITSGTTLGAVPVLAHATAPSSGATAHPLYTPSVLLSPGTYYLYAKSTASGTNGVGIQRTNI